MASADDSNPPADSVAAAPIRKPPLKISIKRGISFATTPTQTPVEGPPQSASQDFAPPPPPTPSADGQPKKIRIKGLAVQTPANGLLPTRSPGSAQYAGQIVSTPGGLVSPLTKTKAGRTSKPTAKKRGRDDPSIGVTGYKSQHAPKRIKLTSTPSTTRPPHPHPLQSRPSVVLKKYGKKPPRPPGQGYDSEAEDREDDPVVEEQFILRMLPGDHADYVRKAIQEKKVGLSRQQGGADIALKWLDEQSRRACLTVEGQPYAGVMVDLPTITEGMKTWNKKALVKSADICQMLLIFAKVKGEIEAKEIALPGMVGKGFTWPHGLTPPMHDCVHRRFRKRLSKLEIKNKEEEVSRLLRADKDAMSSRWELMDERPQGLTPEDEESEEEEYDGEDEDAEGEMDMDADGEGDAEDIGYFPPVNGYDHEMPDEEQMATLAAEVEAEFLGDLEMDDGTPAGAPDGNTPMSAGSGTPLAAGSGLDDRADGAAGGDAEEDFGDEDDDDDDELDEDEQARADEIRGAREDAAELKRQLAKLQSDLDKQSNQLLRKRIEGNIKKVKSELQLKLGSIGEDFEE